MNFSDKLFIIKRRLFSRKNIFLIFVFSITIIILFSCVTAINFIYDYVKKVNESVLGRSLIVWYGNENANEISKLEHVDIVYNDKYRFELEKPVKEFDNKKIPGLINMKALVNKNDIVIVDGRNIENSGEAVCSKKFYPHSVYKSEYSLDTNINKTLFIDGKKILNKKFHFESANADLNNKNFEFKIVGTYENIMFDPANTCYVSISDYDNLSSKYLSYSKDTDENGNEIINYQNFEDLVIRVDKSSNIDKVFKELEGNGFSGDVIMTWDTKLLSLIKTIPIFISLITIVISFNILYSFINKKNKYYNHEYGILKASGYTDKNITSLNIIENCIITSISILISLILYFICYSVVTNIYLTELIYNNYYLPIPYSYILAIIALVYLIVILITKYMTKKTLRNSTQWLLKG